MRFITNSINLSKPKVSLEDLLKNIQSNKQVKTASAQPEVKTAEKHEKCTCGKEDCKDCKDQKEEKKEEKPCMADSSKEVKTAEDKGVQKTDTGKKEAENFTNDGEKKAEESSKTVKNDPPKKDQTTSGQPQWEGKQENNNNPKKTEANANVTVKNAVPSGKFESIANLKPEVKAKVKAYWRAIYGEDYANAMVADK